MRLSISEINEIIYEIEQRYPVEKWMIQGLHIWFFFRIQLCIALFYHGREADGIFKGKNKLFSQLKIGVGKIRDIFAYCYARIADIRNNADLNEPYNFIFLSYALHRTLLMQKWYDRFCEPYMDILSSFKKKSLLLEMSRSGEYRIPRYGKSRFIQPYLDCIMIRNKLFRKKNPDSESLEGFSELTDYLKSKYNEANIPTIESLRYTVNTVLELKEYFGRILQKTKPSIVFIAEYYSIFGSAMILACRECGIKSVDIQHGMGSVEHVAYGRWEKLPDGGYEMFPTVFWCWSDYEADIIRRWNGKVTNLCQPFAGGNLWENLWRGEESEIARHYDKQIKRLRPHRNKEPFILFTPSIRSDITDWILCAIRMSQDRYKWWIRLHPCMDNVREKIRRLFEKNGITDFEIDQATDLPLQALLRHADVNITAMSSTVVEAERFGVPSVITDSAGLSVFSKQIASGCAVTAFNAEDLLKAITQQAEKKRKLKNEDKSTSPDIDSVSIVRKFLYLYG